MRPLDQTVAAGQLARQQFLALGTAVQIGQRAARLLGQLMGGAAHPLGPTGGKGGEVFQQDAGAAQIAHHEAGLIEGTQSGHETQAVKARKNADDILGVLRYKGRRGVAGCGGNFDFHTNVLSHRRRPVCPPKITGKAATKTGRRCQQSQCVTESSERRPVLVAALPRWVNLCPSVVLFCIDMVQNFDWNQRGAAPILR